MKRFEKTFPAPAKLNLHLHVGEILPDGRHALDTSFAFVDVADQLSISPSAELEITCSLPQLNGPENLVHRALSSLAKNCNITKGLRVHIDKRLPEQGGLGGGSSDAATALWVANKRWQTNLSTDELIQIATPLGADIPCFLFGEASLAQGVGERLVPFPEPLPPWIVVLAYPGEGLSTAEVFRHHDTLHKAPHADTIALRSGRTNVIGDNDLEQAACELSPKLSRLLAAMREASPRAWMSGSGSTCVAMSNDAEQGLILAETLKRRGLAAWTHVGHLQRFHPLRDEDWGVAKR